MKPGPIAMARVNDRVSRRTLVTSGSAFALTMAAAGCSAPSMLDKASDSRETVTITDANRFDPGGMQLSASSTVVWKNQSRLPHTVSCDPAQFSQSHLPAGSEPWDSGDIQPGRTWAHKFDTPGQYVYVCHYHGETGMIGTIDVT
jgi:plastocyanin